MRASKASDSLRICADSPEPSLLAVIIFPTSGELAHILYSHGRIIIVVVFVTFVNGECYWCYVFIGYLFCLIKF